MNMPDFEALIQRQIKINEEHSRAVQDGDLRRREEAVQRAIVERGRQAEQSVLESSRHNEARAAYDTLNANAALTAKRVTDKIPFDFYRKRGLRDVLNGVSISDEKLAIGWLIASYVIDNRRFSTTYHSAYYNADEVDNSYSETVAHGRKQVRPILLSPLGKILTFAEKSSPKLDRGTELEEGVFMNNPVALPIVSKFISVHSGLLRPIDINDSDDFKMLEAGAVIIQIKLAKMCVDAENLR